jgi:outer membrane protein
MRDKIISLIALLLSVIIGVLLILNWQQQPQIGYVKNADLFNSFNGTKELERRLEGNTGQQKAQIDSLYINISMLREKFNAGETAVLDDLKQKEQVWVQLNQQYKEVYQQKSQEYTSQSWEQLNQYMLDFGVEHGYDYIFGANGDGALMYGSERKDLTKQIIKYANDKYEGN